MYIETLKRWFGLQVIKTVTYITKELKNKAFKA